MSLDNFKIVLQDGTTYDMADDFSVLVRSFRISSPAHHARPSRLTDVTVRFGLARTSDHAKSRQSARSLRSTTKTRYYCAMK
jgi:hypothetical protein